METCKDFTMFTIVKMESNLMYTDGEMDKLWYTHKMEECIVVKAGELNLYIYQHGKILKI